jgi:hypothetical protein
VCEVRKFISVSKTSFYCNFYQPASIKLIVCYPGNAGNAVAINLLLIFKFCSLKLHGDESTRILQKSYMRKFQKTIFPPQSYWIPALRHVAALCSTGSGKKRETSSPAHNKNTFAECVKIKTSTINRPRPRTTA